jgi:hypothetical protein
MSAIHTSVKQGRQNMELWIIETLKQYVHIPAIALAVNIIIDLLKPIISRLPFENKNIYRVGAFVLCFPSMFIFDNVQVFATVGIDGMLAAILSVFFYDCKGYPYLRDKLKERFNHDTSCQ